LNGKVVRVYSIEKTEEEKKKKKSRFDMEKRDDSKLEDEKNKTGKDKNILSLEIVSMALSRGGRYMICLSDDGYMYYLNMSTGKTEKSLKVCVIRLYIVLFRFIMGQLILLIDILSVTWLLQLDQMDLLRYGKNNNQFISLQKQKLFVIKYI
jgi:hypothetical protein